MFFKKGLIPQLLQNHDLKSLEQHLIYSYLRDEHIDFSKSPVMDNYLMDFKLNRQLYFDISSLNITTLKELENYLELIIPSEDKKLNGTFFTPEYIIDFIISEIQPAKTDLNLDPSCGCGAFLIGLTEYYKKTYAKPIRDIIKENIYGSDILNYNIRRAKIILTIYALQNDEYLEESDFNLFTQDSLRAKWNMAFDNIVGNPPYVKLQDLSDRNRDYLARHWETVEGGAFNLYFAFFELGYQLLKPTGKLGYITPNNYFTSLSGQSLRKYFHRKKCVVRIIDFSHKKVFDAQTYTAITFLNRNQNETIAYDRIKGKEDPKTFLSNINSSPNYLKNLNMQKWRLLKTDEQENIKTIETAGQPIGELFDICVGVATLKDTVFFIDGDKTNGNFFVKITSHQIFKIEREIVRPVYKISDFKSQYEVDQNIRKIIFPYQVKKGMAVPIPEKTFMKKYPHCYDYLLSEKKTLQSRDKGKVSYEPFYAWGRTQGLTKTGKRIVTPTFSQHPRFLLIEEENAYFTNGYGLFFKKTQEREFFNELVAPPIAKVENIDVVQKILNSYVMDYYIQKTSVAIEGGYPCYQKNFIEKFTIPVLTESEIDTIRNLGSQTEVNEYLLELYQLNLPVPNLLL